MENLRQKAEEEYGARADILGDVKTRDFILAGAALCVLEDAGFRVEYQHLSHPVYGTFWVVTIDRLEGVDWISLASEDGASRTEATLKAACSPEVLALLEKSSGS